MIDTTKTDEITPTQTFRYVRFNRNNFKNKKFEHDLKEILEIEEIEDEDLTNYLKFLWNTDTFLDAEEAKDYMIPFCEGYKFLMLKQKGE